jgi:hypothetical protein
MDTIVAKIGKPDLVLLDFENYSPANDIEKKVVKIVRSEFAKNKDFKKIDEAYDRIKNGYYKLCNTVIIPMLDSSKEMTSDDVYWKKEEYDEGVQKMKEDIKRNGYTTRTLYLAVYDKENNKKITDIAIGSFPSSSSTPDQLQAAAEQMESEIINDINSHMKKRYRKYPRYNREFIENFIKEAFPKQLTFKDYVGVKDYIGEE